MHAHVGAHGGGRGHTHANAGGVYYAKGFDKARPYSAHVHTQMMGWWPAAVAVTELNQRGKLKTYRLASAAVRGNIRVCVCVCVCIYLYVFVRLGLCTCVCGLCSKHPAPPWGFHYYLMLSHLLCHLTNQSTPTYTRLQTHTHTQILGLDLRFERFASELCADKLQPF